MEKQDLLLEPSTSFIFLREKYVIVVYMPIVADPWMWYSDSKVIMPHVKMWNN